MKHTVIAPVYFIGWSVHIIFVILDVCACEEEGPMIFVFVEYRYILFVSTRVETL